MSFQSCQKRHVPGFIICSGVRITSCWFLGSWFLGCSDVKILLAGMVSVFIKGVDLGDLLHVHHKHIINMKLLSTLGSLY